MLLNSCWLVVLVLCPVFGHLEDELDTNDLIFTRKIPRDYYRRSDLADCHSRFHPRRVEMYQTAVFGGTKANETEFPHMAVVGWANAGGGIDWGCGGSLITKRFVLTAAHCMQRNGISPTVVKLGDVDLATSGDDRYSQQFNVKDTIRHPQHSFKEKYFDLALIELDGDVILTPGVCPACLWHEETIPYEYLDVAGFGATGFAENTSPNLLKATISPADHEMCVKSYPSDRGLPQGITGDQLCAVGPHSDTCPGDSGGPLQMTLRTYHRKVAFLVGVTSFGSACGLGTYGVYQKVAPHLKWIESVVKESLDPLTCVKNYENYLVQEQLGQEYEAVDAYFSRVYLHWQNPSGEPKCGGTLIDYNTVVTSAHCIHNSRDEHPVAISILGQRNRIIDIQVHRKFEHGRFYHDIALLRLKKYLRESDIVAPPCLPYTSAIDAFVAPNNSVSIRLPKQGLEPKLQIFLAAKSICGIDEIIKWPEYSEKLPKDLGKSLSCYKADYNLVPGLAEADIGGPLLSADQSVLYGINVLARDGGSYSPLITLNLERNIRWIEEFVLDRRWAPSQGSTESAEHLVREEGSPCVTFDRKKGHCRAAQQCRGELERYQYGWVKPTVCSYQRRKMIICCPRGFENTSSRRRNG